MSDGKAEFGGEAGVPPHGNDKQGDGNDPIAVSVERWKDHLRQCVKSCRDARDSSQKALAAAQKLANVVVLECDFQVGVIRSVLTSVEQVKSKVEAEDLLTMKHRTPRGSLHSKLRRIVKELDAFLSGKISVINVDDLALETPKDCIGSTLDEAETKETVETNVVEPDESGAEPIGDEAILAGFEPGPDLVKAMLKLEDWRKQEKEYVKKLTGIQHSAKIVVDDCMAQLESGQSKLCVLEELCELLFGADEIEQLLLIDVTTEIAETEELARAYQKDVKGKFESLTALVEQLRSALEDTKDNLSLPCKRE